MSTDRFTTFFQTFERVVKNIRRIATPVMQEYGLRSGHVTCILALSQAENGLTVSELARECAIDKALSSRIVRELVEKGFLAPLPHQGSVNYNKRFLLTPSCHAAIEGMTRRINQCVSDANRNLPPEELKQFYCVLAELDQRIEELADVAEADPTCIAK